MLYRSKNKILFMVAAGGRSIISTGTYRELDPRGGLNILASLVQGGLTLLPTTSKLLVEGTGGSKYFTLDCDLEGGSKLSRGV